MRCSLREVQAKGWGEGARCAGWPKDRLGHVLPRFIGLAVADAFRLVFIAAASGSPEKTWPMQLIRIAAKVVAC